MGVRWSVLMLLAACVAADIYEAVAQDSKRQIEAELAASPSSLNSIHKHHGQTPLMNAVLTGKVRAVKYLLERKADTTIGEKDGYTPMHGAGFQGRAEIAQILIDHGLDAFDVHKDGDTPMTRACLGAEPRHLETANFFIKAGATRDAINTCLEQRRKNWDPFHQWRETDNVLTLLSEEEANSKQAIIDLKGKNYKNLKRNQYKQKLIEFYKRYGMEDKLDGVDATLRQWKGREDEMLETISNQYNKKDEL